MYGLLMMRCYSLTLAASCIILKCCCSALLLCLQIDSHELRLSVFHELLNYTDTAGAVKQRLRQHSQLQAEADALQMHHMQLWPDDPSYGLVINAVLHHIQSLNPSSALHVGIMAAAQGETAHRMKAAAQQLGITQPILHQADLIACPAEGVEVVNDDNTFTGVQHGQLHAACFRHSAYTTASLAAQLDACSFAVMEGGMVAFALHYTQLYDCGPVLLPFATSGLWCDYHVVEYALAATMPSNCIMVRATT